MDFKMKLFLFKKQKSVTKKRGFTLVELLVAASILVTALGAPLYVGIQGVIIATEAKDRIIATFLAEEGAELIRNIRDTNVLGILDGDAAITSWRMNFAENVAAPAHTCLVSNNNTGCYVGRRVDGMTDPNITPQRCGTSPCPNLQKISNAQEDKFGYTNSGAANIVDSGFNRTVRVTEITPNEVKVSVTVEWYSRGVRKDLTIEEHLFNYVP
jgi:prepilin-type N-terminal cleavage/methylation domain-containing protein